jgi:hypothetical protein
MRRRTLACAALAASLAAQGAATGDLTGTVRSGSGEPIAGARLTLTQARTGQRRLGVTRSDGRFAFRGLEPGPCSLRVEAAGHGTQRLTGLLARPGATPDLSLELMPADPEMVLDSPAESAPPEPSRTRLATDLGADQLRALPLRLEASVDTLADLGPWPRQANPAQSLDGLETGSAPGLPTLLGRSTFAQAQVLAAGGPVDQAAAEALLAASSGGGNALEGAARLGWSREGGDLALSLGGPLQRDRWFLAAAGEHQRLDGTGTRRAALRLDWAPSEAHQGTLMARGLSATADGPRLRDRALGLAHRWTPAADVVNELRLQSRSLDAALPGLPGAWRGWQLVDLLTVELGSHLLRGGLDLRQARQDSPDGPAARHEALFAEDAWTLAPAFTLSLGLRRDRESRAALDGGGTRSATSPRLSFVWRLAPQVQVYGGHGRFLEPAAALLPGLALDPERDPRPGTDRRDSHLGLAYLPLPGLTLRAEARLSEAATNRLAGLALSGRWELGEVLSLNASYTRARDTPAGAAPWDLHRLRLWLLARTGERPSAWTRDWTFTALGRFQSGGTPEPGQALVDLRLGRTFPLGARARWDLALEGLDLLDRSRPAPAPLWPQAWGRQARVSTGITF